MKLPIFKVIRLIMKVSCILFVVLFGLRIYSNGQATEIQINSSSRDKLKLSQLSRNIKVIPLDPTNTVRIKSIEQVLFANDYFFVLDRDGSNLVNHIFQFDYSGKFIRQIATGLAGKNLKMALNEKEHILTVQAEESMDYNYLSGTLLPSSIDLKDLIKIFSYNAQFWGTRHEGKEMITSRGSWNQGDTRIYSYNYKNPPSIPIFSVSRSILYMADPLTDIIYEITNDKAVPKYKFEFVNNDALDRFLVTEKFVAGHFLVYGYGSVSRGFYSFVYDLANRKSYNIEMRSNELGINDDMNYGGPVAVRATNLDDHIYCVVNAPLLVGKVPGVKKDSNPVLYLLKL